MSYRPWYERDPDRFVAERKLLEQRGFELDEDALIKRGVVQFFGPSRVDASLILRIEYPDGFPSLHPSVFTQQGIVLPSHHRADSGEICTFGFSQSTRWRADHPGSKAVDEAEQIISLNLQSGPEVLADDVPEPLTDIFPYGQHDKAVIIPENLMSVPLNTQGTAHLRIQRESSLFRREFQQMILQEVSFPGGSPIRAQSEFNPWLRGDRVSSTICTTSEIIRTPSELRDHFRSRGIAFRERAHQDRPRLFLFAFRERVDDERLGWIMMEDYGDQPLFVRCYPFTRSDGTARVPGLHELSEKSVTLVGLGALGSRVAVHLAQAGVGSFSLVDYDAVSSGNLVRYEGGLDVVGLKKTFAVEKRVLESNPFSRVACLNTRVGGPMPKDEAAEVHRTLVGSDLVIDLTASHATHRFVNEVTYQEGVPALYAWVTNGAWGSEVVRIIPGETPCFLCFTFTRNSRAIADPTPLPFAPGCSQPTFTGTGFDTAEVAAQVGRLAVQTLLRSAGGYPDMSGHYLVWNNRGQNGAFEPKLLTEQFDFYGDCYVCGH